MIEEVFDEALYLQFNPDVAQAVSRGEQDSGWAHFTQFGRHELPGGRRFPFRLCNGALREFDERLYLQANPDVARSLRDGRCGSGAEHFLSEGLRDVVAGSRPLFTKDAMVRLLHRRRGSRAPTGERACIFAHYNASGAIDRSVFRTLQTLQENGCDIVFVTHDPLRAQFRQVREFCVEFLAKSDAGRGFGSWYVALRELSRTVDRYDTLILMNDSCFFPVLNPRRMFQEMQRRDSDLWGMTDSVEGGLYHIQSYFLVFGARAKNIVLKPFVANWPTEPVFSKGGQTQLYEIGFSQKAIAHDLSLGVLCPDTSVAARICSSERWERYRSQISTPERCNPSRQLWPVLLQEFGVPFVKKIAVAEASQLPNTADCWRELVDNDFMPHDIIADELRELTHSLSQAHGAAGKTRLVIPAHARGMRIGLFGGSFNPPHEAHRAVSLLALKRVGLDRVWWLVSPGNPLKDSRGLPPLAERVAAARALAHHPRIAVTDLEARIGTRYSVDTIRFLARRCPGVSFVWVMGVDNFLDFHRWRAWRAVFALVPVAVVDRGGTKLGALAAPAALAFRGARLPERRAKLLPGRRPPAWVFLHGLKSPVSSTTLRAKTRTPGG